MASSASRSLFVGVGALLSMRATGALIDRHGDVVLPIVIVLFAAAGVLPAVAHGVGPLALALGLVGVTSGGLDVAVNTAATEAEERTQRSIMSLAHGLFSIGVIVMAAATGVLRSAGASPLPILAGTGLVLAACAAVVTASSNLAARPPEHVHIDRPVWWRPPPRLLVLGLLVGLAFLVESVWQNWSAVHLERDLDASPFVSALGPAVFGTAAAIGRLAGSRTSFGLSRNDLVRAGALLAAVGTLIAALATWSPVVLGGIALAGLGTSICAPILLSITGDGVNRGRRGSAMGTVTTLGYLGFALAPAIVGGLAQALTLPTALAATSLAAIALAAGAMRARAARHRRADVINPASDSAGGRPRPSRCRPPTGSRPCRPGCARPGRRARGAWAPCSRRAAACSAPPAPRGSGSAPAAGWTTAVTALPHRSSGTPTTRTSATDGWPCSTPSTSSGCTFSPPVLIDTEPRPSSSTVPSSATVARSPVMSQRSPS